MKKKSNAAQRLRPLKLPSIHHEDAVGPSQRFAHLKEACIYGGFGKQKAYDLIHAGHIRAVKLGKSTMVDLASIDRFYASLPKVERRRGVPIDEQGNIMTKPQPKVRELHDEARKALDELRVQLRVVLGGRAGVVDEVIAIGKIVQRAEDAIDDADAVLLRGFADIEDAVGKVM